MPGVNREGLEILLKKRALAVIGRRSLPVVDGTVLHQESRAENYRHVLERDPSIETAKIAAKIEHGVLSLTLPKAEQVKPRKISVE